MAVSARLLANIQSKPVPRSDRAHLYSEVRSCGLSRVPTLKGKDLCCLRTWHSVLQWSVPELCCQARPSNCVYRLKAWAEARAGPWDILLKVQWPEGSHRPWIAEGASAFRSFLSFALLALISRCRGKLVHSVVVAVYIERLFSADCQVWTGRQPPRCGEARPVSRKALCSRGPLWPLSCHALTSYTRGYFGGTCVARASVFLQLRSFYLCLQTWTQ